MAETKDITGSKILVTGGSGFLGGHIIEKLAAFGVTVLAPRHAEVDLVDESQTRDYIVSHQPDYIIHCAGAISGLLNILKEPADIFDRNLRINMNVLKYAHEASVKKVVNIGSTCAYPGELPTGYYKEDEFLNGPMHASVESYGFSKRAMYIGSKAYRQQYGLNAITLLLTNMYGPRDVFSMERAHVASALIKKFMVAKRENQPTVEVLGTGKAVREFVYVEDAANAVIRSLQRYDDVEPLNIGTGEETPIADLAQMIKDISGYTGEIVWNREAPDGALRKVSDISKAKQVLDWEPAYDLKRGLTETIAWFDAHYDEAIAKQ